MYDNDQLLSTQSHPIPPLKQRRLTGYSLSVKTELPMSQYIHSIMHIRNVYSLNRNVGTV